MNRHDFLRIVLWISEHLHVLSDAFQPRGPYCFVYGRPVTCRELNTNDLDECRIAL